MRLIAAAAACVALFPIAARADTPVDCGAPAAMPDGWPVAAPADEGFDPKLICSVGPAVAKLTDADPHGVVVARKGKLVYEQYFTGEDLRGWTPVGVVSHDANTPHNIQSITKSV